MVGPGVPDSLLGCRCVGENVLSNGGEVGFEHPGGYGEYFLTEAERLWRIPESLSDEAATLVEPLAVAVRAVRRMRVRKRDKALIFGDGPIGLLVAALLRAREVRSVTLVGGREPRMKLAMELGVQAVLNYHRLAGRDLTVAVREHVRGNFPLVVEASGSLAAAGAALGLAAAGGRVIVVGDYGDACVDARWNMILHRELTIVGSNASAGAWAEAVRLVSDRVLPLERLVSHVYPVERYQDALTAMDKDPTAIKVVLSWRDGRKA